MTTLHCAICRKRFGPDNDHIWVDAELRRVDDRNETDEYALHPDCWRSITDGWMNPA